MLRNTGAIYADGVYDTTEQDLLPDEALLMDWDTVDAIDITQDGDTAETIWKPAGGMLYHPPGA